MTNQNNAAQPVLTDDEINDACRRHAADTGWHAENDRKKARAVETAVLSKLRAPVADEPVPYPKREDVTPEMRASFERLFSEARKHNNGTLARNEQGAYRDLRVDADWVFYQRAWADALASAPVAAPSNETLRLASVIADKIQDGTLFQAGIFSRRELADKVRTLVQFVRGASAPVAVEHPDGLRTLLAELPDMRDDPKKGDAVFRCGVNGALDVVEGRIRELLASAPVAGEVVAWRVTHPRSPKPGWEDATREQPPTLENVKQQDPDLVLELAYAAPQASEAHTALNEWFDKTDFIQKRIASGDLPVKYLGWHRADVMRDLIDAAARNQVLPSGCILVQEADTIPHTHPEYGPGIFFTEDARIEFDAAPQASAEVFDFAAHLARQAEFSAHTFGPGARVAGVCDHIRKELIEVEASGGDLKEWVDVIILGLDGAWRSGATPQQIIAAIVAKQTKNEARTWPDWRTVDPTKAIEHDRGNQS